MIRLLGLGDNTVDTYVDQGLQFPGGNALNVAVLAARCGAQAGYLGSLGGDAAGAMILAALAAEGVDASRVRQREGANARAFIGHESGERRFLRADPGVRGDLRLTAEDFAWIGGWDHVHSSINSDLLPVLPDIRGAAQRLSFDFSEKWTAKLLAEIVPLLDVAVLSCPGRTAAEVAAILRSCSAMGAKVVIATMGAEGALALADGVIHAQPALPARVVDTLGAGDGLIAGFLVAWLVQPDIPFALGAGACFASQVCAWQGAFGRGTAWAADGYGAASSADTSTG